MAIRLDTIPFERTRVTLRLRDAVRFHFEHGGVIQGLLRRAVGAHEMPPGLLFFAAESGRSEFKPDEPYAFSLTFAGDTCDVPTLLRNLAALGRAPAGPHPPILGGNFDVDEVRPLPPVDLARQLAEVSAARELTLRFVSPFRLDRPEALQRKGATFMNRDCFTAAHFLDRLWRRLFRLHAGRFPHPPDLEEMPPLDATIESDPSALLWIDLPIPGVGNAREDRPKGMTLGGVLGSVRLRGVPQAWLEPLILGQYLHAGEKTAFGLGRYVIEECGTLWDEALRPARSILSLAAERTRLRRAFDHVDGHSDAAGIDHVTPEQFGVRAEAEIDILAQRLADGTWEPPDLVGFVAAKPDGGLRALAIPTVADRVAQRAACELLAPSIDTLLEDCSYAYRKGFSRGGAAQAVERAWTDGFRWVLDADITSFFDAVEWERLFAKLHALFPVEPLIPLVERWVSAAVVYEGKRIERQRGLPQGSPLAPLLANLFLDEFDEEILGRDYRLLRYADDFVILCRDVETARAAKEDVQHALASLGLELDGEQPRPATAIPEASWLAQVPLEHIRPLARQGARNARSPEAIPLARETAPTLEQSPLYVVRPGAQLSLHEGRIVVKAGEEPERSRPIRSVSHVVCFTGTHPTIPLLLALAREGKPVYFCSHDGTLDAAFQPWDPDWTLWSAQLAMAGDPDRVLRFIRALVTAKLHNAATLVRRLDGGGAGNAASAIRELERGCDNKTEPDSLRGMEGKGAALFFEAYRTVIPPEWGFRTRQRHPPPDPVNAMLSFAYTILHNHAATALVAAGLNPRTGIFHQGRGTWQALASDLSEELRHLAEGFVVSMIRRREIRPADFIPVQNGRGVLLKHDARREFIRRFEERLLTSFTPAHDEQPATYLEFVARQAARLRAAIVNGAVDYQPLRVRA